jgi:hypothetical protein
VKDGSGALYDFAGQGKTIKARANSLTCSGEEDDEAEAEGTRPKHTKHLDFQLHNPLKFKREGSRVKTWMAYKNSLILRSEFIM